MLLRQIVSEMAAFQKFFAKYGERNKFSFQFANYDTADWEMSLLSKQGRTKQSESIYI